MERKARVHWTNERNEQLLVAILNVGKASPLDPVRAEMQGIMAASGSKEVVSTKAIYHQIQKLKGKFSEDANGGAGKAQETVEEGNDTEQARPVNESVVKGFAQKGRISEKGAIKKPHVKKEATTSDKKPAKDSESVLDPRLFH